MTKFVEPVFVRLKIMGRRNWTPFTSSTVTTTTPITIRTFSLTYETVYFNLQKVFVSLVEHERVKTKKFIT